jgi:hypothetical protein
MLGLRLRFKDNIHGYVQGHVLFLMPLLRIKSQIYGHNSGIF